jgi:hypothetical protein
MPESSRVQADGTRLPFAGGAFETALSFGSIEHFPMWPSVCASCGGS